MIDTRPPRRPALFYIRPTQGILSEDRRSLYSQKTAWLDWCEDYDWKFVQDEQLYIDEYHTINFRLSSRPAGKAMLSRLKKNDLIMMTSLDRGFKNFNDFITVLRYILEIAHADLAILWFGRKQFDSRFDDVLIDYLFSLAQFTNMASAEKSWYPALSFCQDSRLPWGKKWKYNERKQEWVIVDQEFLRRVMSKMLKMELDAHTIKDITKFANRNCHAVRYSLKYQRRPSNPERVTVPSKSTKKPWTEEYVIEAIEQERKYQKNEKRR